MSQKSRTESEELLEGASNDTFSEVFTDEELLLSSPASVTVSEKPELLFEEDLLQSESSSESSDYESEFSEKPDAFFEEDLLNSESSKNSEESQSSKSSEATSTTTTDGKSETSEILEFSQSAVDYRISTKTESQDGDPNQ